MLCKSDFCILTFDTSDTNKMVVEKLFFRHLAPSTLLGKQSLCYSKYLTSSVRKEITVAELKVNCLSFKIYQFSGCNKSRNDRMNTTK